MDFEVLFSIFMRLAVLKLDLSSWIVRINLFLRASSHHLTHLLIRIFIDFLKGALSIRNQQTHSCLNLMSLTNYRNLLSLGFIIIKHKWTWLEVVNCRIFAKTWNCGWIFKTFFKKLQLRPSYGNQIKSNTEIRFCLTVKTRLSSRCSDFK